MTLPPAEDYLPPRHVRIVTYTADEPDVGFPHYAVAYPAGRQVVSAYGRSRAEVIDRVRRILG